MASINVSIPESLKDFLQEQVSERGYRSPQQYVEALLRDEQKRQAKAELEAKLLAGLKGPPITANAVYWKRKLARLRRQSSQVKRS